MLKFHYQILQTQQQNYVPNFWIYKDANRYPKAHYSSTFEGSNTLKHKNEILLGKFFYYKIVLYIDLNIKTHFQDAIIRQIFCNSQILAALLAVVAAEPYYGGVGYGYSYNALSGNSFIRQSRLDGLGYRGKRDADAYGYGGYGYGGYGYGAGIARHPTGTSFVARSPQGLRGKRSAEADAYGYGGYGYGRGVAAHYGGGSSYVGPTVWGLRGKRSAGDWGYSYPALSGNSFISRSGVGYYPGGVVAARGKRSAEPGWGYNYNALSGNSFISRSGTGYYPGGVFSG